MATSHGTKVSHVTIHSLLGFSSLRDVCSSHMVPNKDSSLTYLSEVTKDPRTKEEIPEAVGTITSDSLAAESLANNGEFGRNDPESGAASQPSRSTTTNNRDTSSATTPDPASNAEAREVREGKSDPAELNAGCGLGETAGRGLT